MNRETLSGFLKQFLAMVTSLQEYELLVSGIFKILLGGVFLDRKIVEKSFKSLLDKTLNEGKKKHCLIKLDGSRDGGSKWFYHVNSYQNLNDNFTVLESINDLLPLEDLMNDMTITFLDDGAYSGKQVVSIFQEIFGVPTEERTTDEIHLGKMDERVHKIFTTAKIVLNYVCFNPRSEAFIKSEFRKLDIYDININYEVDLSKKNLKMNCMTCQKKRCDY